MTGAESPARSLDLALERATRRVTQLRARQLLRVLRREEREKSAARKALQRRALALGDAALDAGFGEWGYQEFFGLLLEAHERVGASRTMRMGYRERGERHEKNGNTKTIDVPQSQGSSS